MDSDKKLNPEEIRELLKKQYGPGLHVEVVPQAPQTEESESVQYERRRREKLVFDHKPSDIKEYLDRFVIQQDEAKKVLATAICDHYHHIQSKLDEKDWRDYKKQNILLIGPTGVGKTYLIQNIARLIGVPFVKADATKYSETGYVGGDVEDLVRELVAQADGDVQLAEYGIIYLDEIDKLASPVNILGRDVSGHGVQRNLLKLMEETEVPLRSPNDIASQMQSFIEFQTKGKIEKKTINTRHILFIVSGAFNGLTDIIKKRIGSKQIGFTEEKTSSAQDQFLLEQAKSVDFLEFGFEAEFIGRLPVIVHTNDLSTEDMFKILKFSEGSILKQYKRDFLAYGIDVYFNDGGMHAIAQRAAQEKTGARGLMSVCEKLFRDFKYRLPDSPVKEFIVSDDLVKDPAKDLAELLETPTRYRVQVQKRRLEKVEEELEAKYNVHLSFSPEAAEWLADQADEANQDTVEFCRRYFSELDPALNLLSQSASSGPFEIGAEEIQNLGKALEKWIRNTYKGR